MLSRGGKLKLMHYWASTPTTYRTNQVKNSIQRHIPDTSGFASWEKGIVTGNWLRWIDSLNGCLIGSGFRMSFL